MITLLIALTAYTSTDDEGGNVPTRPAESKSAFTSLLDTVVGEQRNYNMLSSVVSGVLILTAWCYNLARGAFVGPWYEAFTIMLLAVMSSLGLGFRGARTNGEMSFNRIRKATGVVFHVFIIYFLSIYLGREKTGDNLVSLGLVVASAVLSVSGHNDGGFRVNSKLNMWADLSVRVAHSAVAILALVALDEMSGDMILHAIMRIGAILKVFACFLPVCHTEFLMRNSSTLLLLLPSAALYSADAEALQMTAFAFAVIARGVDAVQNTIISGKSPLLGNLVEDLKTNLSALPPRGTFDNPTVYVVVTGLITSSSTLIFGGDEACADGILDPSAECSLTEPQATSLRFTIALTWTHALLALVGSLVAMFEQQRNTANETFFVYAGYISASTLELIRTTVSTTVLGLLAYVAHSATVGSPGDSQLATWLYISLFSYIFVDTLGRNVV